MRELEGKRHRVLLKMKLVIIALLVHQVLSLKLPDAFPVCYRNDPRLNDCFRDAVQKSLSLMVQPIPELSIPSIEPLKFERVEVPPSNSDRFRFTLKLTDIEMYNLKSTEVMAAKVRLDETDLNAVVTARIPWLKFLGNYEIEGKILVLVINGEGTFTARLDDVGVVLNMTGNVVTKKGQKHMTLTHVSTKIIPKDASFRFNNLFKDNEELTASVNRLFNENWKDIYEEIGSTYEGIVAAYVKNLGSQIFKKIPLDDLFPVQ